MSQTQFENMGPATGSLPSGDCAAKAWAVAASSANVTSFLITGLQTRMSKLRATAQGAPLLSVLEESNKLTLLRHEFLQEISSKTWKGKATKTDLENIKPNTINYIDVPAMEGVEELNQTLGQENRISQIVMAYYVDDQAQINRGYVVNDQIVDDTKAEHKKMVDVIDKMFHSWLVSHDMASDEQGMIYHRNKNGDLTKKLDKQELASFRTMLEDESTGFHATIEKIDPNIKLTLIWSPPEVAAPTSEVTQP